MMDSISYSQFIDLMERSQFDHVTIGTSGSNILSNDVQEERILIPLGLVLSDTSGAANTITIDKVEEDNSTTTLLPNVNIGGNETKFISVFDDGLVLPRLEGGTNIQGTAGSGNVETTLVWVHNLE